MSEFFIPAIPAWYLVGIGLVIIAIEVFFINLFVIFWFGLATILIGLLELFIKFERGESQLLLIALIGSITLFLYLKRYKPQRKTNHNIDNYSTGETGVITETENGLKVQYKGTLWDIAQPTSSFLKSGDCVTITALKDNKATIQTSSMSDSS